MCIRADQAVIGNARGTRDVLLITAFSRTMQCVPISIEPPSAMRQAPNMIRECAPIETSPHTVAVGATEAVTSMVGFLPLWVRIMIRALTRISSRLHQLIVYELI